MRITRIQAVAVAAVVAALAGLGAIAALGLGDGDGGEPPRTIAIELRDSYVVPKRIEVAPGERIALQVTNLGMLPHDLVLEGGVGTRMLEPGESQVIRAGPYREPAWMWCSVPGHREAGMTLRIIVVAAPAD
jgi:nitrite reductase (NO-forming)